MSTLHRYYVVLDRHGHVFWHGRSESLCAENWVEGTFWGGGRDMDEAERAAMRYVKALKKSKAARCGQ